MPTFLAKLIVSLPQWGILMNFFLMFFNLLPIPPLDGFTILLGILPFEMAAQLEPLRRYGFMILLLAVYAGWLPAGGWDWSISSMVLPVVTLSLPVTAYIARLTRGSMIEVMHSNFIRTARAKGLPESLIIRRHALRPALLPVISYLGPATAGMISGSVIIERIFSIPGLGSYFVQGALNRDYTLVMGVVIFYGVSIILLNFLIDLIYAWLNPRVRYDEKN